MKNGDAMVDGIQLGRVFTMFEEDEVRAILQQYCTSCLKATPPFLDSYPAITSACA